MIPFYGLYLFYKFFWSFFNWVLNEFCFNMIWITLSYTHIIKH